MACRFGAACPRAKSPPNLRSNSSNGTHLKPLSEWEVFQGCRANYPLNFTFLFAYLTGEDELAQKSTQDLYFSVLCLLAPQQKKPLTYLPRGCPNPLNILSSYALPSWVPHAFRNGYALKAHLKNNSSNRSSDESYCAPCLKTCSTMRIPESVWLGNITPCSVFWTWTWPVVSLLQDAEWGYLFKARGRVPVASLCFADRLQGWEAWVHARKLLFKCSLALSLHIEQNTHNTSYD